MSAIPHEELPPLTAYADDAPTTRKGNGSAGEPVIQQYQPAFPYTWVSDAKLELDGRYLVKGLIEQGSFAMIYGPSGSGKSFFTADIAQHIATGQAWRGRKVNKSLVAYVASEAGASILKRFVGWRNERLGEAAERIPLAVLTRGPNLILKQQVEALREQLARMQDEVKLPLGLVVFDTLSRSMPGGDENKAEDMTEVISASDHLRDVFKSATGFVHHTGKDVERGARGHSSLFAAADCVLRIDNHVATLDKIRDGVSGEQFPFSLTPIELGEDADGEMVTTCLLDTAETGSVPSGKIAVTGKNQKLAVDVLRALIGDKGKAMPGTSVIPQGVKAVSYQEFVSRMLPKMPDVKAYTARQRISGAVVSLQASGHAGVHDDFIWLLR